MDYNFKQKVAFVSIEAQKIAKLNNKEYRDAFVGSQISVGLPFQIRALREQRGWKQFDLADKTGMLQPRISAMEAPGKAKFTLETLRRLASAFDVALIVKFAPFSELVRWSEDFDPDAFSAPPYAADSALHEQRESQKPTSRLDFTPPASSSFLNRFDPDPKPISRETTTSAGIAGLLQVQQSLPSTESLLANANSLGVSRKLPTQTEAGRDPANIGAGDHKFASFTAENGAVA